ncbi:GIY-YIG nuclease family protein [Arthrobacter mangrovi]|uniref:Bacteriophage T5 Orf172 DNA-binding domain-containing protein n=1 Tax=Arthrobacter mangrovi TaxID=2966350 RepID=A0ABQ5MZV3_9MICC|nr:GIY-YIG nuclease family protein [Arthrobacter mangrovi]GLB69506.1 hypothetical protein AHIS1636_39510 [Arthrobacter mangrovi]
MGEGPDTYRFEGIPLTPNVIAELAQELMAESIFRRSDLIERVQEYHTARGGALTTSDVTSMTKKALQTLTRTGALEPAGTYGRWRWLQDRTIAPVELGLDEFSGEGREDDEIDFASDAVVDGIGQGSVYAYYFPSYKELACLKNEDRWPLKVGMTSLSDAHIRITDQQGTALPEAPVVAYIRRTDTPRKLEQALHSVLFFRGQQLEDAPGSEWFWSNPEEIKSIVDWVFAREWQ